jgi:nucleoside 2-deoxyribosyltransferase
MSRIESDKVCAYVAGPFFNKDQSAHYDAVVSAVEDHCRAYSVTRDGVVCPPTADQTQQDKAFSINAQKIEDCHFMVAILDYFGVDLRVTVEDGNTSKVKMGEDLVEVSRAGKGTLASKAATTGRHGLTAILKPIALPDAGTVWEMGACYMCHKPVIGVLLGKQNVNLMLARGTIAISRSFDDLHDILDQLVPAIEEGKNLPAVIAKIKSQQWAGEIV